MKKLRRLNSKPHEPKPITSLPPEILDLIIAYLPGRSLWRLSLATRQLRHLSATLYAVVQAYEALYNCRVPSKISDSKPFWLSFAPIENDGNMPLPLTSVSLDYFRLLKRYGHSIDLNCLPVGIGKHKSLLPRVNLEKYLEELIEEDVDVLFDPTTTSTTTLNHSQYTIILENVESVPACVRLATVLGELGAPITSFVTPCFDSRWKPKDTRSFFVALSKLKQPVVSFSLSDDKDSGDHVFGSFLEVVVRPVALQELQISFYRFSYLAELMEDFIEFLKFSGSELRKVSMTGQGRGLTMEQSDQVEICLQESGWALDFLSVEVVNSRDEWRILLVKC
ncbi:hypothetical protein BDR26DRAFT_852340 [Obelidium mucronatum]|nr:hypothetical protein BDR26DRAFT_852340 [Obelidium mucronatum]